jgi:hypothetical protein
MFVALAPESPVDVGAILAELATAHGSAGHPHARRCTASDARSLRNLADLLHLLMRVHDAHPGLIEAVASRNAVTAADRWLDRAATGFAAERDYLARLSIAAGPCPSTPGEAACAAAVRDQRRALMTLAGSDRFGCALGAAFGLASDWRALRSLLDETARRLEVAVPPCLLPTGQETLALVATLPPIPRLDRAIGFGARQMTGLHRALWDLLERRAAARADLSPI